MADKYSYKPGKKKKTVRRPIIAQPVPTEAETEGALTPDTDIHPIVASKSVKAVRAPATITPVTSASEGRGISQAGKLGSELRRFALISGFIIIVLVGAALVLK